MENWKQFKYRSLWQHPIWAAVQRANGRQVWTLEKDNAQAVVIKHELPFGLSWLEVPRGPLYKDDASFREIMKEIEESGKKERAVFVRFSSYRAFSGDRFVPTKHDRHPETSLVIDLDVPDEEILAQMKQKGRYNIKIAEKHDVKVAPSDDMDTFYYLLSKTGNRDGFGVHPKEYYSNMLGALGQYGQLLLATYEDRVVAGGIFVYLDEWGIYYYGASEIQYRNVMASYLVQWTAVLEAKQRGCKYYDFLGIAPEDVKNHPWSGVTSYKKKFGGRIVEYPKAKDLVLRPFWYFMYQLSKVF